MSDKENKLTHFVAPSIMAEVSPRPMIAICHCPECDNGSLIPVECKNYLYCGNREISLPNTILIPTCDECGAQYMDRKIAKMIDAYVKELDEEYKKTR